jgi:putative FmdB family regulatory protein
MPTYEYECTQGCSFEVQQSIKDDAYATCRVEFCPKQRSGIKLRRLISASRFILKGGGWYSDGYSSGSGGGGGGDKSSSSGGGEKSSSSSDSSSSSTATKSESSKAPASAQS